MGRLDEALPLCDEAISAGAKGLGTEDSTYGLLVHTRAEVLLALGEHARALDDLELAISVYGMDNMNRNLANACVQAAGAAGQLGRLDEAFAWLERARRGVGIDRQMLADSLYDALRDDPRFATYGG